MALPSRRDLQALLRWRPPQGVISIYLDLEPGDRGEAWRIELRNGLREATESAREEFDREARLAVERTAEALAQELGEAPRPDGRARIGFVEAGGREQERWYSLALPTGQTRVAHAPRPLLRPMLAALDRGAPRGVVAASSEQVRLLGWAFGEVEEVATWGLEIFSRDWRDRRSRVSADPARAQGPTSSGRDQFDQRLEANRERFLREAGQLAAQEAAGRPWQETDVFAEEPHFRLFADGFGSAAPLRHLDPHNVVGQPAHAIAARLEALLPEISRERERALIERVRGEAHGGTRGAVGLEETLQALEQGRVEHLLLDPGREYELAGGTPLSDGDDHELPLEERMVELALSTSASVTLLEDDVAAELDEQGGVAALLRY